MADDNLRPSDRSSSDAGMSIIELLVTMIVFSVAVGLTFQVFVRVQRYTSNVSSTADASSELRQALAQIDRQVRSGNVLGDPAAENSTSCTASGAGTCFRVYTQASGIQRCVQWQVTQLLPSDTTRVLRSRNWSPAWQTDGQTTSWAVQARGLALASASPTTPKPFVLGSNSSVLQVYLEAVDARRPGVGVPITSSLFGRNSNYGYATGVCSPAPPG